MKRPDEHGREPSILTEALPHNGAVLRWTVPPGLEDLSVTEAKRLLGSHGAEERFEPEALGLPGHVALRTRRDPEWVAERLRGLRSAYHLIRHHGALRIGVEVGADAGVEGITAEELAEGLREMELPELASGTRSFRVSCSRDGTHRFKSPDVERAFGAVLVEEFQAPVDLEHFAVHVRIDIVHQVVVLGVQLTDRSLDRRYPWVYRPRVTLRTTVAYCMLALAAQARGETAENPSDPAGANAGEAEVAGIESAGADRAGTQLPGGEALGSLLDPFCGSGTIAVEAAAVLPQAGIVAADKREEAVEGTRANLKALGLTERIGVMQADARDLDDHFSEESMDAIVTNPPFGVRLHKEADFRRLYERFLRTAHTILTPGGVIVMLVGKKRGLFNKLLRELALYDLLDVRIIEIGGVYPGIFVLRKRGES